MPTEIPVIPTEARLTYPHVLDSREILRKEMDKSKIPISIGKTCPVKCTFCYEIDHTYRQTEEPGRTTQDEWNYILDYISKKPTRPNENWVWGGNEYMEWTDLFLHPKAMEWLEDFLKYTDKGITMFTVGYVHVPKIHQLAAKYPNRINFELSVITLHKEYRKALMPHAPSISHLMKVLDGPAVTSANFYSFDSGTMSEDAERVYETGIPNPTTIHTEPYITAFLNRYKIMSLFDNLELDKHDTVVMAKSVYKILSMYRKKRARFLYVPNATLGGDSDCTILLTFQDILKRLNGEKVIHLPKCIIESPRGNDCDISGMSLEEFKEKSKVKVKILGKVNTKVADKKLWEHGYLNSYIHDYVRNPASKEFERMSVPA